MHCCHSERSRGIAIIPVKGPLARDGCDSSPPPLRGSARNDNQRLTTMPTKLIFGFLVVAAAAQTGCSRFVWHEDPFTPDLAPTSQVIAASGDTTYVFKNASYYLLSQQRSALWNRQVLDDVAWRYRELFSEAPLVI